MLEPMGSSAPKVPLHSRLQSAGAPAGEAIGITCMAQAHPAPQFRLESITLELVIHVAYYEPLDSHCLVVSHCQKRWLIVRLTHGKNVQVHLVSLEQHCRFGKFVKINVVV